MLEQPFQYPIHNNQLCDFKYNTYDYCSQHFILNLPVLTALLWIFTLLQIAKKVAAIHFWDVQKTKSDILTKATILQTVSRLTSHSTCKLQVSTNLTVKYNTLKQFYKACPIKLQINIKYCHFHSPPCSSPPIQPKTVAITELPHWGRQNTFIIAPGI